MNNFREIKPYNRGVISKMKEFTITFAEGHSPEIAIQALRTAYIEHVLKNSKFNVSEVARKTNLSRGTIRTELKKFGNKYVGSKNDE